MKECHKVPAATLAEVLIVLAITTLVVGLAFAALNLVQGQYGRIKRNFEASLEVQTLEQQLWIDFHRHADINYDARNDLLAFSNGEDQVTYRFEKDHIIRNADTLAVENGSGSYYLLGESVTSGAVDALKLTISNKRQVELFVFKQNDAKQRTAHELSHQ